MDSGVILGIVGIVATILFGFLSFDLFKRKRYPGKVTYIKLSLIDLLNNVANNFKEIKLLHHDSPIKKNIIYIKGALINNGDIDINSQLIEKNISVHLPEKCKWLDIKITELSEGLSANVETKYNEIAIFTFDLFKRNEYLQFEGLIEASNDGIRAETIESKMIFKHRIENTRKIEAKNFVSEKEIKEKTFGYLITFSLVLLLLVLLPLLASKFGKEQKVVYFTQKDQSTDKLYKVELEGDLIELSPIIDDGKKFRISVQEFNDSYIASTKKLNFRQVFKGQFWLMAFTLGVYLIFVSVTFIEINIDKRLSKILKR